MLLASAIGCTNLEFLDPNICGNLVVETDIGEDCDGSEGCGAPNSEHACRFTCETGTKTCPEHLGYHCGADGVCRQPSGTFVRLDTTTTTAAQDLLVGDINADGCAEVVIGAKRLTTVHAFSSSFSTVCVESQQTLNTNRPDPEENSLPLAALADLDSSENTGRLSLVSPTRSLYGDGLSMYFTSGEPTLQPVLFPRFLRGGAETRTVSAKMRGSGVIILFEAAPDGVSSDVTVIFDSQKAPETFPKAYPQKVTDIAAVVAADVDPKVNSMPDVTCDEIIIGKRGDSKLELYKLCTSGTGNGFTKLTAAQIALTNSTVRDHGTAIFAADANGDLITDLITNLADEKVHVAYGIGDGRFHSLPPPTMPPPTVDQKAPAINDPMANEAAKQGKTFVALEFDSKHPGIDYYAPPCPPLDAFSSPTCAMMVGGCEAVVDDIDADGDMDVIVSEGQGVDLGIHRQTNGTFNVTFLETACPPHHLGTGDFDGDGVNDIAFFDQTSKAANINTTSLSIVYGNAYAAPNEPVTAGRFDEATGLSVVRFTPPGTGSQIGITRAIGAQATRGSALGVVELGSERTVGAPYYITSDIMGAQSLDSLTLAGQTPGKFGTNAAPGLAVLTQSAQQTFELWLVGTNDDAGSLRATPQNEMQDIPCASGCLLVAIPRKDSTDALLLLGDKTAVAYNPETTGFVADKPFTLTHTFRPTVANTNQAKYYPRPLVADVDHDGSTDVLALATSGALVGFFGNASSGFTEVELIAAPSCWDANTGWGKAGCGSYVAVQIDVNSDGVLDVLVAGSQLPSAEKNSMAAYAVKNRALVPIVSGISIAAEKLSSDTDFVALGAADLDNDGVRDLVFMPSSDYFTVLRGLPVHE